MKNTKSHEPLYLVCCKAATNREHHVKLFCAVTLRIGPKNALWKLGAVWQFLWRQGSTYYGGEVSPVWHIRAISEATPRDAAVQLYAPCWSKEESIEAAGVWNKDPSWVESNYDIVGGIPRLFRLEKNIQKIGENLLLWSYSRCFGVKYQGCLSTVQLNWSTALPGISQKCRWI